MKGFWGQAATGFAYGLAIFTIFLFGTWVGGQKEQPKEQCITGTFLVPSPMGVALVAIAEQQLCGKDLRWSGVYGPNFDTWREDLEKGLPPPQSIPHKTAP